jgi:hypothetical protein
MRFVSVLHFFISFILILFSSKSLTAMAIAAASTPIPQRPHREPQTVTDDNNDPTITDVHPTATHLPTAMTKEQTATICQMGRTPQQ